MVLCYGSSSGPAQAVSPRQNPEGEEGVQTAGSGRVEGGGDGNRQRVDLTERKTLCDLDRMTPRCKDLSSS